MKRPGLRSTANPDFRLTVSGPVLIVGGGPSAPADLAKLAGIDFAAIISANLHGFVAVDQGLIPRVDYVLLGDVRNSETREFQEPIFRTYNKPLLGRHPCCDYSVEIPLPGVGEYRLNAGQLAIVAGCHIGGSPVYPVGLDCWQHDDTYWHDTGADVVCMRQEHGVYYRIPAQLRTLKNVCKGYDVRPQSGPLLSIM
ncbi:MAG: hypothetical protein WD795_16330 [Woeseia sp.]